MKQSQKAASPAPPCSSATLSEALGFSQALPCTRSSSGRRCAQNAIPCASFSSARRLISRPLPSPGWFMGDDRAFPCQAYPESASSADSLGTLILLKWRPYSDCLFHDFRYANVSRFFFYTPQWGKKNERRRAEKFSRARLRIWNMQLTLVPGTNQFCPRAVLPLAFSSGIHDLLQDGRANWKMVFQECPDLLLIFPILVEHLRDGFQHIHARPLIFIFILFHELPPYFDRIGS